MKKDIIDLTKEVAKDKPELDKIYYGKNVLSGNYQKFVANLDKDEKEHKKYIIPTNESKFYYDNQMIKQVFTPHEDPKHYIHILAYYPFEKVYLDTMYLKLKNSTLAILNIMDLFTKYAYSWCGVLP